MDIMLKIYSLFYFFLFCFCLASTLVTKVRCRNTDVVGQKSSYDHRLLHKDLQQLQPLKDDLFNHFSLTRNLHTAHVAVHDEEAGISQWKPKMMMN